MRVGFITSNVIKINTFTKKGTEIFDYLLIKNLVKQYKKKVKVTVFASGNSKLPTKTENVNYLSSSEDSNIVPPQYPQYEMALISKAFSQYKKFDLYHFNISCGELILPYLYFAKRPVLITIHGPLTEKHMQKYFSMFRDTKILKRAHFISISNTQRKPLPWLPYTKTIYHGVDIHNNFQFNPIGGNEIIWTGRAIPDKGLDVLMAILQRAKKSAKVFPIIKEEYLQWLHEEIIKKRNLIYQMVKIYIDFDVNRKYLSSQYQTSKVFVFPLQWEEPFGLTIIESMACGTPVITYARGSMPELVKDGVTGFLVNPSKDDIRGDFIIKKTGIDGMCEAVERLYKMSVEKYKEMRQACRKHVEDNFTIDQMTQNYVEVYEQLTRKNGNGK